VNSSGRMTEILKRNGFTLAAAAPIFQGEYAGNRLTMEWNLYEISKGNKFYDLIGRVFEAPKVLKNLPSV
jgi:hypothetical protein